MSKKFWAPFSIKQVPVKQTPASLTRELRLGREDVSKMTQPELASHMTNEAKLLKNIREASGLPAVRPTQDEMANPVSTNPTQFNIADTTAPVDITRVNRNRGMK